MILESTFKNGAEIPRKFGYKNENVNPPLKIQEVPSNAKSLVLIMDDPDAMGAVGKIWVHWLVWNINPNTEQIKENSVPENSVQGKTDFGETVYGGPAPPDKEHVYIFKLYALDSELNLKEGSSKNQVEEAMKNHVISEARLQGRYAP